MSATSVEAGSSVDVATMLIGKPLELAPVEVSRTLSTTVSD